MLLFIRYSPYAQDFGFGFEEEESAGVSSVLLKTGGEVIVEAMPFIYEFINKQEAADISSWNVKLNLSLLMSYVDIITVFNLNTDSINELWAGNSMLKNSNYTPLIIDEAFLRAYIGPVNIETGFRKLSWGKADAGGPLDVTNPLNYTDLRNLADIRAIKIARPMVHVTWNTGALSRLEGVFIPNFAGHRYAFDGRWKPSQLDSMMKSAEETITLTGEQMFADRIDLSNLGFAELYQLQTVLRSMNERLKTHLSGIQSFYPSAKSIDYFQAGLRYSATIGSADIGAQYYYGNLFRPIFTMKGIDAFFVDFYDNIHPFGSYYGNVSLITPVIKYSRYHQIGIDYAQILFGFNLRAEAAVFFTEDLKGTDGSVQNPFIGWSLGFDRNLFWGINLIMQCNENIRLLNSRLGTNPAFDAEANTSITSTRLTTQLSKKFLRDILETKAALIWDIENTDFHIIFGIIWTADNLTVMFSSGIFAGNKTGEMGQYRDNSYVKLSLRYVF